MTKIDGRDEQTASSSTNPQSLKRLQVDHVDLLQFHEVIRFDVDRIFAAHGALQAFLDAKRACKLRYIGFTGHKDPHIHLYMLENSEEA